MNSLIGETIAALRKERGLTQEALGGTVGVSGQAVSKWECGGLPDTDLLPRIADALGVTVDRLFGREHGAEDTGGDERIVMRFCEYAVKNGRAKTVREVIARLMNKNMVTKMPGDDLCVALENGENILVSDPLGMGFVMDGRTFSDYLLKMDKERVDSLLALIADEKSLAVIRTVAHDTATLTEICAETGLDEAAAKSVLLDLLSSDILLYSTDRNGKTGYCPAGGMVAVWLVLSGCSLRSTEGIRGSSWLSV